MRISVPSPNAVGEVGVRWKPLHVVGIPGVRFGTSWNTPANVVSVFVIVRSRFMAPVRGEADEFDAVAAALPLKPSQNPTNGGPSIVMGSSKLGLTNRFWAGAFDATNTATSSAQAARIVQRRISYPPKETLTWKYPDR